MSRSLLLIAVTLLALLGASGPALAQPATPALPAGWAAYPHLTITATDQGFQVPPRTPAGRTLVTFSNTSSVGVGLFFWKLPAGVSLGALQSMLPTRAPGSSGAAPAAFYHADLPGAPGYAEAGGRTQALIDLAAGHYAVLTEEGAWATPLEVTPSPNATPVAQPAPAADADVQLVDFGFGGIPSQVAPGQHVWQITNGAAQPHQLIVGRIPDGMTLTQVFEGFTVPPSGTPAPDRMTRAEFHALGGIEIMAPGHVAWALLDLPPGTYAVVCLVPDEQTGRLHVALGMGAVFTVNAAATPAA